MEEAASLLLFAAAFSGRHCEPESNHLDINCIRLQCGEYGSIGRVLLYWPLFCTVGILIPY